MIKLLLFLLLAPLVMAQSVIVCEALGGKILYADNAYKERPIASITKVATALVVLDWAERSGNNLDLLATVPLSVSKLGGGNPMGLVPGESITLKDGLNSALVGSDNAAAQTVAEYVGMRMARQRGSGNAHIVEFMKEMNALAVSLRMQQTYFANPHGMDSATERGKSTAADLVRLSQYAMTKKVFSQMVSQRKTTVRKYKGKAQQSFSPTNTNSLVGELGFKGIKTGMTQLAGSCLASYCERDGARLICIVLGANDRAALTRAVVNECVVKHNTWVKQGRPLTDVRKECISYKF